MISSENNIQNQLKKLSQIIKNDENNNENDIPTLIFQLNNNKLENKAKNNQISKIKKQPLKNIENTIVNNIITINKASDYTTIKQSKIFLEKNIYRTITKQPSNNYFNPFNYSKEERYSLLKMKKIKNNKFSPYKSTNHLYNKVENNFDNENNDSKFSYFKLKKLKKIYSLKKAYISHISFFDDNNYIKEFKLFRDCDIGLNDDNKVKIQYEDFDVNSDDDVIENGIDRCIENIKTAINLINKKNEEYAGKYLNKFFGC